MFPSKIKNFSLRLLSLLSVMVLSLAFANLASAAGQQGRIAFSSDRDGDYEIYTVDPDGRGEVQVTNNSASDLYPSYSADGSKIVFISTRNNKADIYTVDADGSNEKQVTNSETPELYPSFSPNGEKIAFVTPGASGYEIKVVGSNGIGFVTLATNAHLSAHPVFSSDGNFIIYAAAVGEGLHADIYKVDLGAAKTQLTSSAGTEIQPQVSRDGNTVAYLGNPNSFGSYNLYTFPYSGGASTGPLTASGNLQGSLGFSPDGSKIAFGILSGGKGEIYTVASTDGSSLNPLQTAPLSDERDPSWSAALPETPLPGGGDDGGSKKGSLSIALSSPSLQSGQSKKLSKKRFASYIKKGFKFKITSSSGVKSLGASLTRVKTKEDKTSCFRLDKPAARISCKKAQADGLDLALCADKKCILGTYRPLFKLPYAKKKNGKYRYTARGKSLLAKMRSGKILQKANYVLTFKAHLKTGGSQNFQFTFRVK